MKKALILFALLFTLTSVFAKGSSEKTVSAPVKNVSNIITMALPVDPDGLDPHMTASASTFQITGNIYETLITVDESGNLIPALAESWSVSDDGLSITFRLRENALFSDGRKCTSAEVRASFERLKGDAGVRKNDYAFITSMETPDERTIVFSMESLNVAALSSFAYPWAAVVDVTQDNLRAKPVGTGAYVLKSWTAQQSLILEKNPNYPYEVKNDGVKFVIMPDLTAEITALGAGEVDLILITGDLASAVEGKGYNIIEVAGNGLQLMAMNSAREPLSDIRVRQAINLAVNKDEVIDAVWWGYGRKIGSHFPVVLREYVDLADTYGYDPERAKALLKEAGYETGLTLRLDLPKNYQEYVNAGLVIAASLENVGIHVDVNIVEWAYWLSEVYVGRNYDLTVVGHTGRLDPYALLVKYLSTGSENYFNYKNERVDELLNAYQGELDDAKRVEYVQEIQRILAEEVPALYIQDPIQIFVARSDVFGFKSYPINIYQMKDVYRAR